MASTTIVTAIGGVAINFLMYLRTKLKGKCYNKAVKEPISQNSESKS